MEDLCVLAVDRDLKTSELTPGKNLPNEQLRIALIIPILLWKENRYNNQTFTDVRKKTSHKQKAIL